MLSGKLKGFLESGHEDLNTTFQFLTTRLRIFWYLNAKFRLHSFIEI